MGARPSLHPKIDRFVVRAIRLPMREPHQTASGVVAESPLVLTDVVLDDGTVGHSVVFTYTPAALGPTADARPQLRSAGEGRRAGARRHRAEARAAVPPARHRRGWSAWRSRRSTWRCGTRLRGFTACRWSRLLGGTAKPVPAYGAVGYDGEAKSARVAEDWAKRGFRGVKAKIGYPTVAEDVAVIRAMRKAVGSGRRDHGRLQPVPDAGARPCSACARSTTKA